MELKDILKGVDGKTHQEHERSTPKERAFGNLRMALKILKPHITKNDDPFILPFNTPIDQAVYFIEGALSWETLISDQDSSNEK